MVKIDATYIVPIDRHCVMDITNSFSLTCDVSFDVCLVELKIPELILIFIMAQSILK